VHDDRVGRIEAGESRARRRTEGDDAAVARFDETGIDGEG
jgi:hypothetical protein